MERRHYFEIPENLEITYIKRYFVGDIVSGYYISSDINPFTLTEDQKYELLVTLPVAQPYEGLIGDNSDSIEF